MSKDQILEKIKEIVSKQLELTVDSIEEESKFIDDLGADSLDIVELVMAFEEEFNVEVPDEGAENIHTVGDAVGMLQELLGSK